MSESPKEDAIWPAYLVSFAVAGLVVLYSYFTQPANKPQEPKPETFAENPRDYPRHPRHP